MDDTLATAVIDETCSGGLPRQPLGWLKVFGPGAIIASLTIGTGELIFSSRGGAIFGYRILFLFVVISLLKWGLVVGEKRYAEGLGDSADLTLSSDEKAVFANAKKADIPMVVILLSGRPLIVPDMMDQSDAFVAAWLPGTEGQGIADVLFGDVKPRGKLSFSWPRSAEQHPINAGDEVYDPLFKLGFGLSF